MADRAPTNLANSRNIALQKGTVPAGFAGALPLDQSMMPVIHQDNGPQPVGMTPTTNKQTPFTIKGGGR